MVLATWEIDLSVDFEFGTTNMATKGSFFFLNTLPMFIYVYCGEEFIVLVRFYLGSVQNNISNFCDKKDLRWI